MLQEATDAVLAAAALTATAPTRDDRERFVPALKAIEAEAAAASLAAGGGSAVFMVLPSPRPAPPLDLYHYEFYSPDPYRDGRRLAEAAYRAGPPALTQYTALLPFGPDEAVVRIAQREVARLRRLPLHRGVHTFTLLVPTPRPAIFSGSPLPALGPETLLIETYSQLCDPQLAKNWVALLARAESLRSALRDEFEAKLEKVFEGGRPAGRRRQGPEAVFRRAVENEFLPGDQRVVLPGGARPSCVTGRPLAEEERALSRLAKAAGVRVEFLVNDPKVAVDLRLRRLTAYFVRPGRPREPAVDVYNAGSYGAIPYLVRGRLKLATAPAAARFLLVDAWTLQLLWRMGALSKPFAHRETRRRLEELGKIDFGDPDAVFPALPTHFIGRIENAALVAKRAAAAEKENRTKHKGKKQRRLPV